MAHAITSGSDQMPECKCVFCGRMFPAPEFRLVCPLCIESANPLHHEAVAYRKAQRASEGRTPDAWMNAAGLVSSFQGGGYDMPLYRHAPSATAPVEPTEDMIRAGVNAWINMYPRAPEDDHRNVYIAIWKAMLAAAPIDSRRTE